MKSTYSSSLQVVNAPPPLALLVLVVGMAALALLPKIPSVQADISWMALCQTLPIPLSDMTATFVPTTFRVDADADTDTSNSTAKFLAGSIILTGGCSDPNGNSAVQTESGDTEYYCGKITNRTYVFYPQTERIRRLPDMLVERYRHAAVFVEDGRLYVVGGRALDDTVVSQIDYLDLQDQTWHTLLHLPNQHLTSDNAAVSYQKKYLYVIGGFDPFYTNTRKTTLAIHVLTLEITEMADMKVARGDAQAVAYTFPTSGTTSTSTSRSMTRTTSGTTSGTTSTSTSTSRSTRSTRSLAYIMGGFNHDNWCSPLHESEVYDFQQDTWTSIPSLHEKRGDKAVVILQNVIYTIGGETKVQEICESDTNHTAASYTETVSTIETYQVGGGQSSSPKWNKEENVPHHLHRFRAAAAAVESTNTVYIFGGQETYDEACQCYKTSNLITAFQDLGIDHVSSSAAASSLYSSFHLRNYSLYSSQSNSSLGRLLLLLILGFFFSYHVIG